MKEYKTYITIPRNITVREYDIRTPKGNKARKTRVLKEGKEMLFIEDFLSTSPFRHGMYSRLKDELDGYIYIIYSSDIEKPNITINTRVREWYKREYPSDDLVSDIKKDKTFKDIFDCLDKCQEFYEFIGVNDSLVRERIFKQLAILLDYDYDNVYNQWLKTLK